VLSAGTHLPTSGGSADAVADAAMLNPALAIRQAPAILIRFISTRFPSLGFAFPVCDPQGERQRKRPTGLSHPGARRARPAQIQCRSLSARPPGNT